MADIGSGIADYPALIITFIVGATVLVLVYISSLLNSSKSENDNKNTKEEMKKEKHADVGSQNNSHKPSKKKQSEKMFKDSKQNFTHPWLLTSLKGHSGRVLDMDFSANGKFLATCAEDRAVVIWSTRDWNEKQHKSIRVNIDFDHARFVKWSPDSKAFLIQKAAENKVEVYKVARRPADGWVSGITKAMTFPKHHNEEAVALSIACNGKFIMSCSEKTEMLIWNLKGKVLAKLDTYLMSTLCARITPCGRFVVASGFTPDVKVWEVVYTKTGDFHQVGRAFELSGHSSGVYDVGFNVDSTRMATVSKDGTWKVFDTKIEYAKGEDPRLLISAKYQNKGPAHLAMSPDGQVVAIATGSSLTFYSVSTGECDKTIDNVYSGPITCVQFDPLGKYVLTTGEKHVRVFHNMTGYRAIISSTRANFRQSFNSAKKERMQEQIHEAEDFLVSFGEETS